MQSRCVDGHSPVPRTGPAWLAPCVDLSGWRQLRLPTRDVRPPRPCQRPWRPHAPSTQCRGSSISAQEVEIGISELDTFIDNNIDRKTPPSDKHLPTRPCPSHRAREYCIIVGRVLFTSVYTWRMGKFGVEPFAASLLLHLLISSMTLESTP